MICRDTSVGSDILLQREHRRVPARLVRNLHRQVIRFLVVGITCVTVDLLVYTILNAKFGFQLDIAKGLAYLSGVLVGFLGNKFWTFESRNNTALELVVYLSLYSITLGVNVGCNRGVLALLGPDANVFAFVIATGVTTILNFLGMRLFTFRNRDEANLTIPT